MRVTRTGFKPFSATVSASVDAPAELTVTLQRDPTPKATPVYKRWWFWTAVGVVVAGGAGTGIYLATRGDDIEEMPEIDLR